MDDDFNKYAALPRVATASLVVINPYLKNLLIQQLHFTLASTSENRSGCKCSFPPFELLFGGDELLPPLRFYEVEARVNFWSNFD